MERQAVNRVAQIGQTEVVYILALYLIDTVDDNNKMKHQIKSDLSVLITKDFAKNDMYREKCNMIEMLEKALFNLDATSMILWMMTTL